MFRKGESIRPGATPERVRAICQLVATKKLTEKEIKQYIYLDDNASKVGEEYEDSFKIAHEELGLIKKVGEYYELVISSEEVESMDLFRRCIAKKVFSIADSTFFNMTKWYLGKNEEVFSYRKWEDKKVAADRDGVSNVTENAFLGWRLWVNFLGFGYISGTSLIPNMYVRVKDVLAESLLDTYKVGEEITADEFLKWLLLKLPEADTKGDTLNLGLSSALRTLSDMGEIELVYQKDAIKRYLYYISTDRHNAISHVVIKGAIK